jgi:hypothetical protein
MRQLEVPWSGLTSFCFDQARDKETVKNLCEPPIASNNNEEIVRAAPRGQAPGFLKFQANITLDGYEIRSLAAAL